MRANQQRPNGEDRNQLAGRVESEARSLREEQAAAHPGRSLIAFHVLFFCSGITALVFQVVWVRGFAIILGSTVIAMAIVLTAFMLGLAIGGSVAERWMLRHPVRPGRGILVYGALELFIGIYGVLLTASLFVHQQSYLWLVGTLLEYRLAQPLVHCPLAIVLLALPTTAMGATLPFLAVELRTHSDTASVYAVNLFGAAVGSLASSFLLIYFLGTIGAAGVAAGINSIVFVASLGLARTRQSLPPLQSAGDEVPPDAAAQQTWDARTLQALAFFSGFVFFACELVWNRVLTLMLGNRVYVTSITLACVLFFLGAGARLAHTRRRAKTPPLKILSVAYLVAACSTALALLLEPRAIDMRAASPAAMSMFTILLVAIPATAMGLVFPTILSLPVSGQNRGTHVGRVYAVNTLGGVVGLILVGYVAIGWLGSNRILVVTVVVLLACIAIVGGRSTLARLRNPFTVVAVGLCVLGFSRWNLPLTKVDPADIVRFDEDAHCIFVVSRKPDDQLSARCTGTELVYYAGSPLTQFVQETQAHLPMLMAPRTGRILVIGSGYGITAGTFGRYPQAEDVDAVEIVPALVESADLFEPYNHDYESNPKVHVRLTDGRHFLATVTEPYDIISINVSDPYLPGSSSFFTDEFYELVRAKLRPGGVVCQHLFGPDRVSLYHGFKGHFPHTQALRAYGNGISVLGSREPLRLRNTRFFEEAPVRSMLNGIGIADLAAFERLLAAGEREMERLEAQPAQFENTDRHPRLEFRRAQGLSLLHSNF